MPITTSHNRPTFQQPGILRAEDLSPAEQLILKEKYGWDGKSTVPTNIHKFTEAAEDVVVVEDASQLANVLESANNKTIDRLNEAKGLDSSAIPTVELQRLPDNVMEAYRTAVNKSKTTFDIAKEKALADIERGSDNPAKSFEEVKAKVEASKLERKIKSDEATEVISEQAKARNTYIEQVKKGVTNEDRKNYAAAIIAGEAFTKTYVYMDGKVKITFREPSSIDEEEVQRQTTIDRAKGRVESDFTTLKELIFRYNLAVCLLDVTLEGDVKRHEVPTTTALSEFIADFVNPTSLVFTGYETGDRPIRGWSEFIRRRSLPGGLYALVRMAFEDFQLLLVGLRLLSKEKDFFGNPA